MGWSATGFRVELGENTSEETREDASEAFGGSYFIYRRTVTVKRAEWRGLTKAGAEGKSATAGWKITARERVDESGQWRVSEEITTYGGWVLTSIVPDEEEE